MNLETQRREFDLAVEKMRRIMFQKGNDYAGEEDRLANFKKAGAISGMNAELNCLSAIATKVARLGVLLHNQDPENESIEDSLIDLANYALLLRMIRHEKNEESFNQPVFCPEYCHRSRGSKDPGPARS